ncbi:MAG: hypothetical protein B6V02_00045 [Thermoprotei archaeon ex4572_64]|nr:MAG: hypothetical protein B6V02_00045 [Thermoprotei archaeon ex4572_64]
MYEIALEPNIYSIDDFNNLIERLFKNYVLIFDEKLVQDWYCRPDYYDPSYYVCKGNVGAIRGVKFNAIIDEKGRKFSIELNGRFSLSMNDLGRVVILINEARLILREIEST